MTFTAPTIEEVKVTAAKSGLPEIEAEKFWNYFSSNGWHVGKKRMVSWPHALAGWKLRWREREKQSQHRNGEVSASVKMIKDQKELERVIARIDVLKNRYRSENVQSVEWYPRDKTEFEMLKTRRVELMKCLDLRA